MTLNSWFTMLDLIFGTIGIIVILTVLAYDLIKKE